ncbi:S8 family serine peptidase [Amycolatopsis endophytica]|uniref:Subtilisin family serine protease n=1 Tax=Amycolatopsis endophytica TaxID=860233 RepID=A0A853AVR9_9PSEU|nr:S8 family serine peptidase [Amycolatopsis endophytica]NYI86724.1 subtilisin family serine protease [Amycolatopsis endophytica]
MPGLGRSLVTFACAVLVLAPVPAAAEQDEACSGGERTVRHLIVLDPGTSEAAARDRVEAACGDLTGWFPRIAVGVATSTDPGFGTRMGPGRSYGAQDERGAGRRPVRPSLHANAEVSAADRSAEQWNLAAVGGPERGSPDVVVGVLDSGIDPGHPDLAGAVDRENSAGCVGGVADPSERAWEATTSAHGTHVAGIIAAADDGKGTTGVAPGTRVASVKVVDDRGLVTPEAVVCGLMWAAEHRMAVTNSSIAINTWSPSCTGSPGHEVVREALSRAVGYAAGQGTLTVAAATNDALDLTPSWSEPGTRCDAFPAALRDVVTVSAAGPDGVKAGYSSYGLGVVDLTAPGGDGDTCVLSTIPGGYGTLCGTSMAAPHVAGAAAVLAAERPGSTTRQLRRALENRARPVPCPADYDLTGDGRQDAFCAGYTGYNGFYGHGMVRVSGGAVR